MQLALYIFFFSLSLIWEDITKAKKKHIKDHIISICTNLVYVWMTTNMALQRLYANHLQKKKEKVNKRQVTFDPLPSALGGGKTNQVTIKQDK